MLVVRCQCTYSSCDNDGEKCQNTSGTGVVQILYFYRTSVLAFPKVIKRLVLNSFPVVFAEFGNETKGAVAISASQ